MFALILRGQWFCEPHQRHYVVYLSKTLYPFNQENADLDRNRKLMTKNIYGAKDQHKHQKPGYFCASALFALFTMNILTNFYLNIALG